MNNFYLIGMPGCGKTTIGAGVAQKLDIKLIDVDSHIVEKEKRTIPDIFKNRGEAYFRKKETEALKEVSEGEHLLISTGGGVILFEENVEIMKKNGKVIFIDTPCENILKNSSLSGRPLLAADKNRIFDLYAQRYGKYKNSADYIYTNTGSADTAIEKIAQYIEEIAYED